MSGDFKGVKAGDVWYRAEVNHGRVEYLERVVLIANNDYLAVDGSAGFLCSSISQTSYRPTKQAALQRLLDKRHKDAAEYRRWLEGAETDLRVIQREFAVEFGPLELSKPCN